MYKYDEGNCPPTVNLSCYYFKSNYLSYYFDPNVITNLDDTAENECYYTNITDGWDFCDNYQYLVPYYYYCCKADYCNNVDADLSQSEYTPILEEFYNGFYECLYNNTKIDNYCNAIDDIEYCTEIKEVGE